MDKIKENKICIIAVIIALLIGRFVLQPKAKVEIKTVEKLVEVIKEVKVEDKKKNVRIIEHKNKDGSSTKETTISEDTHATDNKDTNITATKETTKTISNRGIQLGVIAFDPWKAEHSFGLLTTIPVYGSLSITGMVTTDKKVGVGLTIEF
jgi:hypothetical protein